MIRTLHNKGGKKRYVTDHVYNSQGEADGDIHVIWGISYFTSRVVITIFQADVGKVTIQ